MKAIVAINFANGAPCPIAGQYLQSFDFDAHDGRGFGVYTRDPAKAMRFPDLTAAVEFWRTQSKARPIRADGKPNRPLTSTTVTFEDVP